MRKRSKRSKLISRCDKLLLEVLKIERGNKCEIHNKPCAGLGRFHILPVGKYPRLRYSKENVLLAGWFCSHYKWHHSYEDAKEIEKKIIRMKGENYRDKLLILDAGSKKLSMFQLELIETALKANLEVLKK